MAKRAIILISLVPESKNVSKERIEKEIKESLKCDWFAEVENVTVKK